ncbi:aldehyde dehydrogenase [Rhizobium leguminosarum]|uniref:aldehyde dehydrogenase n=1 Tax=Rhizobium leguminosarum TaxID=384 RepID=UPI0014416F9F|nr:aldehyde dehydrogenase [Rhizobium leguminosarum]NKL85068.1 hypothetical protein [Rhizobium leguminosarum bv. viciae]NKM93656.1 hypothetical protein [Rhizobium leguminosarum bv. viciae]
MNEPAATDTSKAVDTPFSPWRFARTEASKALITEAIADVERYEEHGKLRTRRRKGHDQETFELTVQAILCDLMHHALYRRPDAIYVTRSHAVLGGRNRYRPRVYGKTFPDVLDRLAAPQLGWIVQEIGDSDWRQDARRTSIRPGPTLLARLDTGGITFADLGLACVAEPIILKSEKADFWDEAQVVDYHDTEETSLFRREMRDINDWLRSADIDYGTYKADSSPVPDTSDRDLRRIFTRGRFESGGRLFGGFWQGMSKESRFDRLVIDGEAIVELDYAQMGPRQLYGMAGAVPAASDLYAIPGFEEHRKGIKVVFSSMVFRETPMRKMLRGSVGNFPKGTHISEITEAIIRHHPAIAHLFFTGVGHHVQRQESQIMVDILLSLKSHGIVALPVHDAILVASSNAMVAKQVMGEVFSHHVGLPGLVDVSSTYVG